MACLLYAAYYSFWRYHVKRFQEVREGVFYRVAQPTEFGFDWLARRKRIKTVVSVQLYDFRLHQGLYDFGPPNGAKESEVAPRLGMRLVQWPMGDEASWPWLTPWQFEAFFRLMDDPANWPVAVHCMGGRHRTGTLAALFRLEYDRWPVERTLAEMYSFGFGLPIRLQEVNLRTYLPRPHPSADAWTQMIGWWGSRLDGNAPADYEGLVRQLKAQDRRSARSNSLELYLKQDRPFALPLAQRLIEDLDDPLIPLATALASTILSRDEASSADVSMAAALTADFGDPAQQRRLFELLSDESYQKSSAARFEAVAAGVMNRFTPNRIPYLRPLLENQSFYLADGASQTRYCDAAVARLSAVVDRNFTSMAAMGVDPWEHGRATALAWFEQHPVELTLRRLQPPSGETVVRAGDPPTKEDLSRMQR